MIGPEVRIGAATRIGPYAVIEGHTTIGARNRIFQFASIGAAPQDLKYHGEPSRLEIGDDNRIREFTTIHRGTEGGGMLTRIGNHVLVMNYVHVAHDCLIGDHSILANSTELAGHCVLEEWVVTAGMCGVHQFSRIGAHAMLAAGSKVAQDVPPYSMVAGDRARLVGINAVGLERRGFSPESSLPCAHLSARSSTPSCCAKTRSSGCSTSTARCPRLAGWSISSAPPSAEW